MTGNDREALKRRDKHRSLAAEKRGNRPLAAISSQSVLVSSVPAPCSKKLRAGVELLKEKLNCRRAFYHNLQNEANYPRLPNYFDILSFR